MTVKKLKDLLSQHPDDAQISLGSETGYISSLSRNSELVSDTNGKKLLLLSADEDSTHEFVDDEWVPF